MDGVPPWRGAVRQTSSACEPSQPLLGIGGGGGDAGRGEAHPWRPARSAARRDAVRTCVNVHAVAAVMKRLLREGLPEAVVPQEAYSRCVALGADIAEGRPNGATSVAAVVGALPEWNRSVLRLVVRLGTQLLGTPGVNLSAAQLGSLLAPNLFRCADLGLAVTNATAEAAFVAAVLEAPPELLWLGGSSMASSEPSAVSTEPRAARPSRPSNGPASAQPPRIGEDQPASASQCMGAGDHATAVRGDVGVDAGAGATTPALAGMVRCGVVVGVAVVLAMQAHRISGLAARRSG